MTYVPIDENCLKFHLRPEISLIRAKISPFLPQQPFILTKDSRHQLADQLIPHAELSLGKTYYALIPYEKLKCQYSLVFSDEGLALVYGTPTQLLKKRILPAYRCQDSELYFEAVASLYHFKKAPFATRDFCLLPLTGSKTAPKNTVWINPIILADFYCANHQNIVKTLLGFDCVIPIKKTALIHCMSKAFILHTQIKKEENYDRLTQIDSVAKYLSIDPTPLINAACSEIDSRQRYWPNQFFYPHYDTLRHHKAVQSLCEDYETWYDNQHKITAFR
ncbi:hypothetical protein JZO76_04320 [Enterococcus sp. MJM12]|uniref:ComK protein n=1 Tax=Candidatus Enterococcus myersii TaxID=2815322 RepID=A0ABS3H778_9ENTE|nr:hypothetical protein [Enterococcus sp. MJM12]MBO0448755.1 hypothetical protein [Enterococcus sp. MJM12]